VVALGVVDSESGDHPLGFLVGDELGDRFLAEALGDPDDRLDYELVDVSAGARASATRAASASSAFGSSTANSPPPSH
jgi:hypothetical protein